MVRRNFFEVLSNLEIDPVIEMAKIEKLFSKKAFVHAGNNTTLYKLIDNYRFLEWHYRGSCLSMQDLRLVCNIPSSEDMLNCSIDCSIEDMFLYFEFILNMLDLLGTISNLPYIKELINRIEHNINFLCDKYNLKVKKIEDQIWIVENSEKVSALCEINPRLAPKLLEYSRFSLKGDIKKKQEILSSLALKYEGIKSELRNASQANLVNDIDTLLNNLNIRHNNNEGEHKKEIVCQMDDAQIEEWYDRIFDLILLAFMYNDYASYKSQIKKLRVQLKTS